MDCKETRDLLSLYIDKSLEEKQMKDIEKHLLICDACKKEYEEITFVINEMKCLPKIELPKQFDLNLRAALSKEKEKRKIDYKKNKWIRYSSFAAIFIVGIFSIAMYNNINSNPVLNMKTVNPSQGIMETNSELENPSKDIMKMNAEPLNPTQDTMKMTAEPMLEDSPVELDQNMNNYIAQLDELYIGQNYVIVNWFIESTQVYIIEIQLEIPNEAGDISTENISYRGENGILWKIE